MDLLNVLPFLSLNTSRTTSIHFTSAQNSVSWKKLSSSNSATNVCSVGLSLYIFLCPFLWLYSWSSSWNFHSCICQSKRTKTSHDDHDHIVDYRLESDLSEWEKDYRDYYQDGIQKLLSLKWRYGCMIRPFCNADEHFGIHPMSCTCSDQSSKKSECVNTLIQTYFLVFTLSYPP